MEKLSYLAETLIGSEIVRLGNEINTRIKAGEKIYNYTIGDFNPRIFPIPQQLEQDINEAYKEKFTNYPPADGIPELRNAVSDFIKEREGIDYSANEILIASGGRPLIYSLFKTLIDKGDKVIYAVPSWNNNHYVHMNQGEHCMIETSAENNFMPTAENIAKNVDKAVLLCLCTPQNPTGTTLDAGTLKKICEVVVAENAKRAVGEKKLYIMFDQMYWLLTYGQTEHHNPISVCPEVRPYTIFIDGISKCFAATGVRVGWSMGPAYVIAKMKSLLSHVGAWAPMAEQKATAVFLRRTDVINDYLKSFKHELDKRLNAIYEGILSLKAKGYPVDAIAPQAALYLTVKIDLAGKATSDKELAQQGDVTSYIMNEAKLAIVPFYAFGSAAESPWYRLSVGTCRYEDIKDVLLSLENALKKIK